MNHEEPSNKWILIATHTHSTEASAVANTGATAASACSACSNAPRNSSYIGFGIASRSCPWACVAGFNLSADDKSCTRCPGRPAFARWAAAAAPTAEGPAVLPCAWECNNGYWMDNAVGCKPCAESMVLPDHATWVQVYKNYMSYSFHLSIIYFALQLLSSLFSFFLFSGYCFFLPLLPTWPLRP